MEKKDVPVNLYIPTWPELAVRNIWPLAIKFTEFRKRVPDTWDGGNRTDREFFWNILFYVSEDFVFKIVEDCRGQRLDRIRAK